MSVRATARLFRFGLFEADLENARLTRKGVRIRLQEQPFHILAILLERSSQIVTREELRQELWPAGTYVDFDGSLNAALKRLRAALDDDADNPRFIETVTKRGYRFIAPVTVEDSPVLAETGIPAAVPAAVAKNNPSVSVPARAPGISRRRWLHPVGAAIGIVAAALLFVFLKRPPVVRAPAAPLNVDVGSLRRSVAVLGFQNASGRTSDAWFSTALTEMLRTELGAGGKLRVVPGENVAQFRIDSPWSTTDSLSQQTASRIGKALDSDLLVLGSFAALGDPQSEVVRVDFRLQDAQTGEILYEGEETGSEKQFFGLVAKVGVALRERLDLPMISESEEVSVVSSLPSDPDANRFYSLGLAKLRDADVVAAKDLFLQAEKLAPRFALVHLMLYRAWAGLGYDQKAKAEIKTAYELSSALPEVDKLQIEGSYYLSTQNPDKAVSAYRALYSLYPDSVDYAEQLIIALNNPTHRDEAMAIIQQLRKLPPPESEDPRIDFWQGQFAAYSGGASAAQPFFEKAAAEAASRGQKLLYAHFRLTECINVVYGPHPEGGEAYCKEAYDIFMAAGNHLYAADALRTMGDRRGSLGDLEGARELYKRALALLRPLGEHEKTGVVLNNMAIGYENQGQIAEAEKLYRQAAATWTECGDLLHAGAALSNLADIFVLRGQLREAEIQYTRARKQIEVFDPNGIAYALYSIASLRLYEGDIAGAKHYTEQAMEIGRRTKDSSDIANEGMVMGSIQMASYDLPGARQSFQKALNIFQQKGSKISVAEAEAALAQVSIEEGKFPAAEQALRKALAEFRAENAVMDEVHAETDLARVLLHESKLADARQTVSEAIALSASSADPDLKLPAAIMDARIETAEIAARAKAGTTPDFSAPRSKLENVRAASRHLNYYSIECDTRLALGELELRVDPSAARARLGELAHDAHEHGLNLVSRKASEMQHGLTIKSASKL